MKSENQADLELLKVERRAKSYMTRLNNGTAGLNVTEVVDEIERALYAVNSPLYTQFIECKEAHGFWGIADR